MSQKAVTFTGSTELGQLTQVSEKPIPQITDTQLLVKVVAVAANPTDWKHIVYQMGGEKGNIVGSDVAGIVEKVGSAVVGYKAGDTVAATLRGSFRKDNGGFAEYVAVDVVLTQKFDGSSFRNSPLPVKDNESLNIKSYETAASVPLGLATVGLSFAHNFKLSADIVKNAGTSILIWGGATATGILAIQVAKLVYGLKVITTASKKNHAFLSSIGADATFDYNDKDVIEQIKAFGDNHIAYGYDTVSTPHTYQATYDATAGTEHVNLDNLLFLQAKDVKRDDRRDVKFHTTLVYLASGRDQTFAGNVVPSTPALQKDFNEFWQKLLPPVLKDIKTAHLKVLKPGLESVNEALDLLRENKVSGQKVVFRIKN